jgi:hypothetical protein
MAGIALAGWVAGCGGESGGGGSERARRDASIADARRDATSPPSTSSAIAHVFVVAMENENLGKIYDNATDAPYINGTLIGRGARATSFIDELPVGSPSEPHYIWLEAGTNVFADRTFTTDSAPSASNSTASTAHLAAQIAVAGLSWTAYQEGINATTGSCPNSAIAKMSPGLAKKLQAKQADRQHYDERPRAPEGTLYEAGESGHTHGSGPASPGAAPSGNGR